MDLRDFHLAISQLAQERGIPEEKVFETIEAALAAAYRRDYAKKSQKIVAELDRKTGQFSFWQLKQVVNQDMILSEKEAQAGKEEQEDSDLAPEERKIYFNPERHIMIEEAQKIDPKIKLGEELRLPLKAHKDYGRIAAQAAKQVILQKVREIEREMVFDEYQQKEGEVISGTVQRVEKNNVFFDIGKLLGILPKEEQIPAEFYKLGQRFKLYVLKVEKSPRGPVVFLSRAFPKFISKLFELEVPEIASGQVVIRAIAREPGSRTKIAVLSEDKSVDPIGSMVGQRGTRVMAVISELGGEKIDIVEYSEEPEKFIGQALSPAKVSQVKILPKNTAACIVAEDQLSLAIGKDGQNVRLAAKLTGWKIDVRSVNEAQERIKEEAKESKEPAESVKKDKTVAKTAKKKKPKKKEKKEKAPALKIKKEKAKPKT